MIKMIKVSVIIPVYNTSKYLDKCLNSLINQTLKDIEFIFVNDGSTDNSCEIIKKWMKKDKRIILLNKENGGQASARNLGLKKSRGEYIAFLDSDDYVDYNMYDIMYQEAVKNDLDIVLCNYYFDYNNKIVENKKIFDKTRIINQKEYIISTPSPCNKIIKKEYLDKSSFSFPEGFIYEDYASIPLLGINNPKIKYLNKCLYYYYQSDNSTLRKDKYNSKYLDIFKAVEYLYNNLINTEYVEELEYLLILHFLYLGTLNFYKYKKYKEMKLISNKMKEYFPNWKNNKYLENFTKKEIIYMNLFYNKLYFLINIYRRIKHD